MKLKNLDAIVVHTSATPYGRNFTVEDIRRMHLQRRFKEVGYHFIVLLDGTIEKGRAITEMGAHCRQKGFSPSSYNNHSLGICYIGGLGKDGKAQDTRTPAQKKAMRTLIDSLVKEHKGIMEIIGHRDASPDLNRDGRITQEEWEKMCPCFDAKEEYEDILKKYGRKK